MLTEIPLIINDSPVPEFVEELAREALKRSKAIDCFDFVASSHAMVYRVLEALPRGSWCEWGSGIGINTGIAALLGFNATGIELDPNLAEASRKLLDAFGLRATIHQGSYFEIPVTADYYYVYCWPSQMNAVEDHFLANSPASAKLLICHGAEDVRCKVKAQHNPDAQV
jgi:protein-L-isoaspartate O-methyltransferase